MPAERHVAFVRAIMIGRDDLHREVVLDLFRAAGAIEPRNHLTTGNISFGATDDDLPRITHEVEAGIEAIAGRPKLLFVRSIELLGRLTAPADAELPEGGLLEFVFLPPEAPSVALPLRSKSGGTAVFATAPTGLWAYSTPPEAPGGLVERAIGRPVTVRAWSTIRKILAAH